MGSAIANSIAMLRLNAFGGGGKGFMHAEACQVPIWRGRLACSTQTTDLVDERSTQPRSHYVYSEWDGLLFFGTAEDLPKEGFDESPTKPCRSGVAGIQTG